MGNWFECKVKYQKIDETGKVKNVAESYLVDAYSFTEAESRINKEMEPYISGDFTVTNIKIASYADVLNNYPGDRWFKTKVSYITIDEEKGLERKSNSYMLIKGHDLKQAYENIEKEMSGTVSDYEISAITESNILDTFPYDNSFREIKNESDNNDLIATNDFESGEREYSSPDRIEIDDFAHDNSEDNDYEDDENADED